jgi:putative phosphoribosyl transferase
MSMQKKTITQNVNVRIDAVILPGILSLPAGTESLVIFAHGSGSSRLSPRNVYVAEVLQKKGIGTFLFDLLTEEEDLIYENRFDIGLITGRLVKVTEWLMKREDTGGLKYGYFGSSTGSASALEAAAKLGRQIKAVVSRGGRPDLAIAVLENVTAPTLLIVGGADDVVIGLNKQAFEKLKCRKEMTIVPGATHLFEEPGALEKVASLAADWFGRYLV